MSKLVLFLKCKLTKNHDEELIGEITPRNSLFSYEILYCRRCGRLRHEQIDSVLIYPLLRETKVEYKTKNRRKISKVDKIKEDFENQREDLWV